MAILEVKNLNFKYKTSKESTLTDINLEINEGEFVVLCGESGCGKSTLLKLFKKQLQPFGDKSGSILYQKTEIEKLDEKISVTDIGFVMQNPDNQIATDKVWHELAFGLESLGESTNAIRRRVAEISGFFGINDWYRKKTSELSGGQKQLLNLASIMVMQPKILILDEPTSQLDPIAATDFIATLKKINEELGITIILSEHRLEEVFPIAHKVILMDKARILFVDTPKNIGKNLKKHGGHKMSLGMPTSIRLFNEFDINAECPLTVREGRNFLRENFHNEINKLEFKKSEFDKQELAIEIKEGFFRYARELPDVLRAINLKIYKGEILSILGGNGAGKTTLLKVLSGINKIYSGILHIFGKRIKDYNGVSLYRNNIACLPQNPQTLFVKSKVIEDLQEIGRIFELEKSERDFEIDSIVEELQIEDLLDKHPYDLSGGEQQKCALAKVLLTKPKILLLDEPTKGIDAHSKKVFAQILSKLKAKEITTVIVSHDIEFAAEYSDRCAMFFDGQIVSIDTPNEFFSKNSYYTTAASRMSRDFFQNAVTLGDMLQLCNQNEAKNA